MVYSEVQGHYVVYQETLCVCDMDVISQDDLITCESLVKKLHKNTAILLIQSGGNRLQAEKISKTNLQFQWNTLWPFSSQSTRLSASWFQERRSGNGGGSGEGHLTGQILLVTSVVKGVISRNTAGHR